MTRVGDPSARPFLAALHQARRAGGGGGGDAASAETWRLVRALEHWSRAVDVLVRAGDAHAIDAVLDFLDADACYFRSGYQRARLAGRLASAPLEPRQRATARAYVVAVVDHDRHNDIDPVGRLGRAVADNALRRELRRRLHPDHLARSRHATRSVLLQGMQDGIRAASTARALAALRVLSYVRHPGLDDQERVRARELVVTAAEGQPYLSVGLERLTRWLWDEEWAVQLRNLASIHGPYRHGATLVLRARNAWPGP